MPSDQTVVTKKNPKQGKGDRILSVFGIDREMKSKLKLIPFAEDVSQLSFQAADVDIGGKFAELKLRNIKLPRNIPVTVIIDIVGVGANSIRSNKYICDSISVIAENAINELSDKMAGLLTTADESADDDDKKKFVNDTVMSQFRWMEETAAIDIVKRVKSYPAYVKYAENKVKKWKIKCGTSIALNGVVIVGGATIAGLTWGAAAPAAVIGIARSGVQMAHTIFDLAANIDQIGWMIKKQFSMLESTMTKIQEGDSTKQLNAKKVMNSVKNVGLGVASGLLGAKSIPTVKNCEDYIKTYKVKQLELDITLAKLGPQIFPLEAKIEAFKTDISKSKGSAATTEQRFLDAAESLYSALKIHVAVVDQKSRKALQNTENWSNALEEFSVHGWTNHVATAVGLVTDLGLSVGGAGPDALGAGLSALISLGASVDDLMIDKV